MLNFISLELIANFMKFIENVKIKKPKFQIADYMMFHKIKNNF